MAVVCAVLAGMAGACALVADLPSEYSLAVDASIDATEDAAIDVVEEEASVDASDEDRATLPPDPGRIICGQNSCSLPGKVCCGPPDAASTCIDSGAPCPGLAQRCDEKADCFGGDQQCCLLDMRSYAAQAECKAGCTTPVVCRTDGECTNGEQCVPVACIGYVIRTCGGRVLQGCRP